MPNATKVCKICGKVYPYCRSQKKVDGVFRWQDVACCPEHGSEYLAAVLKARGVSDPEPAPADMPAKKTRRSSRRVSVEQAAEDQAVVETVVKEETDGE